MGYRNTKFFHRSVLIKRRNNKIIQLIKDDGSWITDQLEIGREISINLQKTLIATPTTHPPHQDLLTLLSKIDENLKNLLFQSPDETEVKTALWNINPYKTSREDDIHAIFYQKNWDQTKTNIIK